MKVCEKRYIFVVYTILFTILCMIAFYPFYGNHISLIWGQSGKDGLSQHLASLTYYGEYIRNFFSNLAHGHFKLPMWDTSIGYGSDILSSLNYYAIGDPLNLIYVFSNKYNAEYFYNFMLVFRAYLAGISFIVFGCYLKQNPHGIVVGSLTYVFCGFFLISGIRHPFFLNPMIYFPLLIMGVEKIYRKERPYLFTIIVAIAAMSNFYFFYMLSIGSVIYALIRFPVYKEHGFFQTFFRFCGWYILGLGISMIVLLPVLIGFSDNARSTSTINFFHIFFYQFAYYKGLIQQSIGYKPIGRATTLNFLSLAYCAVIALFLNNAKKRFAYKASTIVAIMVMLFPILGYVFHAFTYPINRWAFILAFVIAAVVTEVYEDLLNLSRFQKLGILAGLFFYYLVYRLTSNGVADVKLAVVMLLLTVLLLIMINEIPFIAKSRFKHFVMYGLVAISVSVSAFAHYSSKFSNVTSEYLPSGDAYNLLCGQETNLLASAGFKNNHLDRIESSDSKVSNWGMVDHIPNTTNYMSITDKNVSDSLMDFGLTQYQYKFKFKKLDLRSNLMNLYHVKYIIASKSDAAKIPDGYTLLKEDDKNLLYENKNLLPFGYTYDSCISQSEYKKLNSAQKEQAMLQSAVISDHDISFVKKSVYSDNTITKNIGTNYSFHNKNKESHKIRIKISKNHIGDQTYVYLHNVRSIPYIGGHHHILYGGKNDARFFAKIAGHKSILFNAEQGSVYDTGKRDYLIDIDTSNVDRSKDTVLTLTFPQPDHYTIDKISVVQILDKKQNENLIKLKKAPHLTNIAYDGSNHFSGNITTKDDRILCIPFAYHRGWKASDNGVPVKLVKVNGMFCGLYLKAGTHKIHLDYTTPGLKTGVVLSFVSIILLIVLMIRARK